MEQPTHPVKTLTNTPEVLGAFGGSGMVSGFASTAAYSDTNGLMLPVQALTAGFVLSPQSAPITAASAASGVSTADANAAMAQMLAESLPQAPTELQALGVGQGLDAEFIVGASQRQGFFLGDVGVMVSYEDGSELTEVPQLYYLPNAPAWFLGMANLHGNMVPVFDLAAYLGVEQKETAEKINKKESIDDKRMLLVLAHGNDAAGVIVHGIPQRLYIMQEQSMAPDVAPNLLLPHVSRAYLIDNTVWFDLEVESLLSALENAINNM